jgi:glycolate oxidase iron-sulfur subunit
MIFDEHRTPESGVVDDCVHCGFCLQACPTYALWAQEADSPRGRIVLIDQALHSDGAFTAEMVNHFDTCLGCMACVPACPSGVRYDRLIERVRPQIERGFERTRGDRAFRRLLFQTLPHPLRLRALLPLLALARRVPLPEKLDRLVKVAPQSPPRGIRLPMFTPAAGERRGRVGLLLGCVQRVFYPQVHAATIGALAAEGFDVLAPPAPDCCGALELHGGEERSAVTKAAKTIAAFPGYLDYVIVNAAGCGSAMKEYRELLETPDARSFSERVRDVTELLASVPARAPRGPLPLRVAYHDACHLAHAQRIREQPRELLRSIPELELLEVKAEAELCCGSAGIYNLVQPAAAADLGERKATHLLDTGAEAIAAANPGCAAQLDRHLRALGHALPIYHPIELVWRSIRAGRAELGG